MKITTIQIKLCVILTLLFMGAFIAGYYMSYQNAYAYCNSYYLEYIEERCMCLAEGFTK